ncbi:TetR/AcrR family transcriptional regulator [Clostridium estertheticum]|uniref:TetR/AcrR family transcriptional regulator n=1 Tax=Clostridium estertheticum TaxID=238834 RepID=UPI001C7D141D|nr:TetR/AcrR family transcriptional regulator [Clostridium estertheticum]MBX4263992.1 TetR/AcrR family transcriptional regulator [Clostridium estertheticum]MBX4268072.1 TetR/AcrR family transcriptional regulator [Clostridium estertheticum]WLC79993.1 TetR/AcrR family transcriptional regulator [Clostridium estertheticum]WLC87102.1 TetR/AcrR family transcriptional regulator [Clostridium estertheticum]
MKREIRIPVQKRSIEKRKKIIDAALKIFNEKGYFNTNTAEIAKEAELATGSLYAYFKDKKDIFLEVTNLYGNAIYNHSVTELSKIKDTSDLDLIIKTTINIIIENHKIYSNFHQEMMTLCYIDNDIKYQVREQQKLLLNKYIEEFKFFNLNIKHSKEKYFLIYSLIEDTCHEIVYADKLILDRDVLIDECVKIIKKVLL